MEFHPRYVSLRLKISAGLLVIFLIAIGGFFYLQSKYNRLDRISNVEESSHRYLADIVKGRLRHAMLTRDPEEAAGIMETIHEQQKVVDVFLINKRGEAVASFDKSSVGKTFALSDPTCDVCHRAASKDRPHTVLYTNSDGWDMVRHISPIVNERVCYACHEPGRKVLGMLVADFSLESIEQGLSREFNRRMVSLALFIFILLVALSVCVDRFVLARLQKCVAAVQRFGGGKLDQDIPDMGRDEIGHLAAAFNQMAANLRKYIHELRGAEEMLYELATHDPLTKLFNRTFFSTKLEEEFQRAVRYNTPLSLIVIDIDHFKPINDTHGHQAGDAYLESLSELIERTVRQVDTVARYGGEELVVILPHTAREGAMIAAERLRRTVADHEVSFEGQAIRCTISLGVASYQEGSAYSVEELLQAADRAMYEAKEGGRNQVVFLEEDPKPTVCD